MSTDDRPLRGFVKVMSRRWRRLVVLSVVALTVALISPVPSHNGRAFSNLSTKKGFDTCAAPSQSSMATWWSSSPYFNIGVYIGGAHRGCNQPNLTTAWVTNVQTSPRRWGFLPIWVGRQMPYPQCTSNASYGSFKISLTTSTAYNQGWDEAAAAYAAAGALAMNTPDMPIIFDLEAYGDGNGSLTTCRNAAKSFINGWVAYLHTGVAQEAGVYGSQCGSFINDLYSIANRPDFIWFAYWNNNPSTSNVSAGCSLPASRWSNDQRHKQYDGPHNETFGGVTILTDKDCADGPVYLSTGTYDPNSPCL